MKLEFNCGVYTIINTKTGEVYVGSSKNLKKRLSNHKCKSTWLEAPNRKLYLDMAELGVEFFEFKIVEECKPEDLRSYEQKWIDNLKPTYNSNAAKTDKTGSEYVRDWQRKHKSQYDSKMKEYYQRECEYEGEHLTYNALVARLRKLGVNNPNYIANMHVIVR